MTYRLLPPNPLVPDGGNQAIHGNMDLRIGDKIVFDSDDGSGGNTSIGCSADNQMVFRVNGGQAGYVNVNGWYKTHVLPQTDGAYNLGAFSNRWGAVIQNGYHQLYEMTPPGNGPANTIRVYVQDNGSNKSQLMAIGPSGAASALFTEP